MDTMTVTSKAQLLAAIKAGAQDTFELAKANPFEVRCGTTTYTFKEGLHERRAKNIIREIHRTPYTAFADPEPARLHDGAAKARDTRSGRFAGKQPVAQVWSD